MQQMPPFLCDSLGMCSLKMFLSPLFSESQVKAWDSPGGGSTDMVQVAAFHAPHSWLLVTAHTLTL